MKKRNSILFFLLAVGVLFVFGGFGIWNLQQKVEQDIQDIQQDPIGMYAQKGWIDTLEYLRSRLEYLESQTQSYVEGSISRKKKNDLWQLADSIRQLNNYGLHHYTGNPWQDSIFYFANRRLDIWMSILAQVNRARSLTEFLTGWGLADSLSSPSQELHLPDSLELEEDIALFKWMFSKKYRKEIARKRKESVEQVLTDWKEELTPEEDIQVSLDREVFTNQMASLYETSEKNMERFVHLFHKSKQFANKMDFHDKKFQIYVHGIALENKILEVKENAEKNLKQTFDRLFNLLLILGAGVFASLFMVGVNYHFYQRQLGKREAFVSKVTHEIKNALHPIIGFASAIDENSPQAATRDILGTVKEESQHLLYLANGILDLSKIRRNEFTLANSPFIFQEALNQVVSSHRLEAEEKGIELVARFDSDIPKVVLGDPERLKQIVRNVLTNALKHTKKGQVSLEVSVLMRKRKKTYLSVLISDTGKGLSRKELRKISRFKPYNSLGDGGIGLGLAISHQLVHQHKGKLKIRSKGQDKGLQVHITLPYVVGNLQDVLMLPPQAPSPATQLNQQAILLIDDDRLNLELTSSWIEEIGGRVFTASNGKEAQPLIKAYSPDLIVLDRQMPEMDGMTFLQWLRKDQGITIPVIMCSGNALGYTEEEMTQMGSDEFMVKPYGKEELLKKVADQLGIVEPAYVAHNSGEHANTFEFPSDDIYAVQKLRQELGENKGEVRKKIRLLTEVCKECLPNLYMGIQAENPKLIHHAVHKMLMICRYLGKDMEAHQADLERRTQGKELEPEVLALSLRFYHLVRAEVDKLDMYLGGQERG